MGQVWMPARRVVLSSAAGEALRKRLSRRRPRHEGLDEAVERVPLDEIGGFIAHQLLKKARGPAFKGWALEETLQAAAGRSGKRNALVDSPATLIEKYLP